MQKLVTDLKRRIIRFIESQDGQVLQQEQKVNNWLGPITYLDGKEMQKLITEFRRIIRFIEGQDGQVLQQEQKVNNNN